MKQLLPKLLNHSYSLLFILSFLLSSLGWGQGSVQFTSGTNVCWTVPCGVTSITVEVIGAGGAGGQGNTLQGGSGGGGGGYSSITLAVTPGQSFRYTVGVGGGPAGGGNGDPGTASTFQSYNSGCVSAIAGVNIVANGGGGGVKAPGATAGAGGTASGGSVNLTGANGSIGVNNSNGGAGGNNGAGSNGAPLNTTNDSPGADGGIGGGGAGGYGKVGAAPPGGSGGSGAIIITWTPISAGPNQTLALCATSTTLAATAAPAGTTGTWSVSPSAGVSFGDINSATSSVSGLTPGLLYTFTWTISAGGCNPSYDQMIVSTTSVTANAGPDQSVCQSSFTMSASTPPSGYTGVWSCSGAGCASVTITDVNSPTTTVTGFTSGVNVTLTWTVSGLCNASDQVILSYPLNCADDCQGAIPLAVGSGSCTYVSGTTANSSISSGMAEGGCLTQRNDVWYSAVVPANGVLTIQAVDPVSGTAPNMYMATSIYSGSCANLEHEGCAYTTSLTTPATAQYTGLPGETVYVRVWNWQNTSLSNFNICASTPTTITTSGNVVLSTNGPSNPTNITCGSTYSFVDPGGTANYANNQSTQYVICPGTAGQFVTIDFLTFALEYGYDKLTILNGSGASATLLGQWTGTGQSPPTTGPSNLVTTNITSSATNGCLTVVFQSDQIVNAAGWTANVFCSSTAGTNTPICSNVNCTGGCGTWICADGLYPTTNGGTSGVEDLNEQNSGCFGGVGEVASKWFYFTALTAGTIEFSFDGPNGQDYDFAVWGPGTSGSVPCPLNTMDSPIRCSYADVQLTSNPVGLGNGATDLYEPGNGNGWVAPLNVQPGETYAMILNIFMNGNPQPTINLDISGSGTLDCNFPLPITLSTFEGMNQGPRNLLSWIVDSQVNNDYFTLERSIDGKFWEIVEIIDGAGTSQHAMYYEIHDETPYFPVSYYRLKQTDFDGKFEYSNIVSISTIRSDQQFITELFPNPTSDFATFAYSGNDIKTPLTVQVFNNLGEMINEVVYRNVYKDMPATLRTENLSYGVYQVRFIQGDLTVTKKLSIIR